MHKNTNFKIFIAIFFILLSIPKAHFILYYFTILIIHKRTYKSIFLLHFFDINAIFIDVILDPINCSIAALFDLSVLCL